MNLAEAFDSLSSRHILLFGGKGGVGKTTLSCAAALRIAESRKTILFTTDPASNLEDIFADKPPNQLTLETLDAEGLWSQFLKENVDYLVEIGDRGTYLDREEVRRFFELALPGVDELMAWMRIGELAEENGDATIVVDTAPTGHTLRMLGSGEHFREFAVALDTMAEKHRSMVRQFTRREARDAVDQFIEDFDAKTRRRREMLQDKNQTAFIPVALSEPLVVEQTERVKREVQSVGLDVPFIILNRAIVDIDCDRCRSRAARDDEARKTLSPVVDAPRSCAPLDSVPALRAYLSGAPSPAAHAAPSPARGRGRPDGPHLTDSPLPLGEGGRRPGEGGAPLNIAGKIVFVAGKGGVGKTTVSASISLQLAHANPSKRFTVISVDPAHSLPVLFENQKPPANLTVEFIDTRAKWKRFRDSLGAEIERVINALTPGGMSVKYDTEALQSLIEVAPPGADELFAITRLADLIADEKQEMIIVDTAPTGHFLRLLDLPRTAGEWIKEFMRVLLRYRELIPPGSLGEELVHAKRSLTALDETIRSEKGSAVVVTRPEQIVIAETNRLVDHLQQRGVRIAGAVANYVTPESDCRCDRQMRDHELAALTQLRQPPVMIERRDQPPATLDEIERLVPIMSS